MTLLEQQSQPVLLNTTFQSKGARFYLRALQRDDSGDIAELARWSYEGRDFIIPDFKRWMAMSDSEAQSFAVVYLGPVDSAPIESEAIAASVRASSTAAASSNDDHEDARRRTAFIGHVVAIQVLLFIDQHTTAWSHALRVHPALRGHSLATKLMASVVEFVKRLSASSSSSPDSLPRLRRLRESSETGNKISLSLAERFGYQQVYNSHYLIVFEDQWHSAVEWVERELTRFNIPLQQVRSLGNHAADGGQQRLQTATVDQLMDLHHRYSATSPDFERLTKCWICYEWNAENIKMLSEAPFNSEWLVGLNADEQAESCSSVRSTRDFSSNASNVSIAAVSVEQCLLHLYHALLRQAKNVRPRGGLSDRDRHNNDAFQRLQCFMPLIFLQHYHDFYLSCTFVLLHQDI